ncbi:hypothetical protein BpHYR1_026196 [Brachionus plicatilis]|uniref:Transmembrane protein n=1 Tax=Brachionus plicatilis TaxID=10195 RepID=A0A3M7SQI5_BRAPC|nr:hypothetical protein BpHYR1_026196 [Brachionus plicatilis]
MCFFRIMKFISKKLIIKMTGESYYRLNFLYMLGVYIFNCIVLSICNDMEDFYRTKTIQIPVSDSGLVLLALVTNLYEYFTSNMCKKMHFLKTGYLKFKILNQIQILKLKNDKYEKELIKGKFQIFFNLKFKKDKLSFDHMIMIICQTKTRSNAFFNQFDLVKIKTSKLQKVYLLNI